MQIFGIPEQVKGARNDMAIYSHIDICAGSGMLGIACSQALDGQLRTACYVEWEAYAAAVLVARMEDETLDKAPVWDNVKTLCSTEFSDFMDSVPRPLLVTAGYPCQPFSVAGKRRGTDDPRHLWPHILRFVEKQKPECCFFENVPGHLRMGFEQVANDLRGLGYTVAAGLFTASESGAPQKRERLYIMANAKRERRGRGRGDERLRRQPQDQTTGSSASLFPPFREERSRWEEAIGKDATIEPTICRMADGMAARVDRLHTIGNGVCTLAAAYAFVSLAACIEN